MSRRLGLLLVLGALASGSAMELTAVPSSAATHPVDRFDRELRADTTETLAPVGREAIESLEIPPLVFDPPDIGEHELLGVPVVHLHDPTLPLVDFHVHLEGGAGHLPREDMAASMALPALLRPGGTRELPPDSLERRIDLLALQLGVQSGGGGTYVTLNALTERVPDGVELLREVLLAPGFDPEALEVWRRAERERVRRRMDDPTSLAYAEFNRLLFGDHPVGWVMEEHDLDPNRLSRERLFELHDDLYCRQRLTLGVAGDMTWEEAEPLLRAFLDPWPDCADELPDPPLPELRRDGAIFVLPRPVEQSTVIAAGPSGIRQEPSTAYYASRIANHVLGGGGLGSRLSARVRSEEGLAYWATSLWTTPLRHDGLVGAVTATGVEHTVQTTSVVLEVLSDFREEPPDPTEVDQAIEQIVNGFVFAFQSASQIVSRQIGYRIQGLPADWLEIYLAGLQSVTPEDVHSVARDHIDLGSLTVLVVGDPERFGPGLRSLGPVYELRPDGSYEPLIPATSDPAVPRESPRSPR